MADLDQREAPAVDQSEALAPVTNRDAANLLDEFSEAIADAKRVGAREAAERIAKELDWFAGTELNAASAAELARSIGRLYSAYPAIQRIEPIK